MRYIYTYEVNYIHMSIYMFRIWEEGIVPIPSEMAFSTCLPSIPLSVALTLIPLPSPPPCTHTQHEITKLTHQT